MDGTEIYKRRKIKELCEKYSQYSNVKRYVLLTFESYKESQNERVGYVLVSNWFLFIICSLQS